MPRKLGKKFHSFQSTHSVYLAPIRRHRHRPTTTNGDPIYSSKFTGWRVVGISFRDIFIIQTFVGAPRLCGSGSRSSLDAPQLSKSAAGWTPVFVVVLSDTRRRQRVHSPASKYLDKVRNLLGISPEHSRRHSREFGIQTRSSYY